MGITPNYAYYSHQSGQYTPLRLSGLLKIAPAALYGILHYAVNSSHCMALVAYPSCSASVCIKLTSLFAAFVEMLLARKAPQPWVLKHCAYHSSSQLKSNQLTTAYVQTALRNHKCTLCLAEAINWALLWRAAACLDTHIMVTVADLQ